MSLKNLSTALDLLNFFTPETPVWGVRALAKEAGQPLAVVQRILATYAEHGVLERTNETIARYQLGMRLYELGNQVSARLKFADLVDPALKVLASETGETVYLNWLNQDACSCIAVQNSPHSIHLSVKSGSRMLLHAGAAAKVILAHFEEKQLDEWLKTHELKIYTEVTERDIKSLKMSCQKIRRQGFAYSKGELVADSFGLAVPVFTEQGQLFGSLALAGPRYRFKEENIKAYVLKLRHTVQTIQYALSHFINKIN